MRLKEIFICFFEIMIFSFLLNFFWESLHGFSLYTGHIIDSDKYVYMMTNMAFGDATTILTIYIFCAFFMKDILWFKAMNLKMGVIFFIIGLGVAVVAEYRAVYMTHEWHYNNKMPIVLGVGLSPFLQLSVTGVISLWLTKRLRNRGP